MKKATEITTKNILDHLKREGPATKEQIIDWFIPKSNKTDKRMQKLLDRLLTLVKRLEDKEQIKSRPPGIYEIIEVESPKV